MKFIPVFLTLAIPLVAASSVAASVSPSAVPADARWVVFADLNTLRGTALGKELVAMGEKAQINTGRGNVRLDMQKVLATVGTAIAYGTNFSKDPQALDGTLVIQGTPDLRKILEAFLLQGTIANPDQFTELKDLPFPAYGIRPPAPHPAPRKAGESAPAKEEPAPAKPSPQVIVAFPPEPVVLVSKSRPNLLKARDVVRGKIPSIAQSSDAPLRALIDNSRDAYLFAASIVPSDELFPADQPQARILKMTNSGAIAIGDREGKTFAHAELVATSDEMADKLNKILQGMTAVLSLAETNDKELAEFLNSVTVTQHDRIVTLNLAYSSDRLAQMVHSMLQEHVEHRGNARPREPGRRAPAGEVVAQWKAEPAAADPAGAPAASMVRRIDQVKLRNGSIINLNRRTNGGKNVRFERIEIAPGAGGGSLSFRTDLMRVVNMGSQGSSTLFEFPGEDGTYNLKVTYRNDPDGKATYTVTVENPKPSAAVKAPQPPAPPEPPAPAAKPE
ncbi:MAG TPA: hypothetical protein VHE61_22720 [Opitutaceae bacterium]|nr:hypothetical protein [Opitutaceae bacterium]